MRITDSILQMASSHQLTQRHEVTESLRVWRGDRPDGPRGDERSRSGRGAGHASDVALSQRARQAAAAASPETAAAAETQEGAIHDKGLSVLISVIEWMTGQRVEVFDPNELTGKPSAPASEALPPEANAGAEYRRHESVVEDEQTQVTAQGVVHTADGREIRFQLSLAMTRHFAQSSDSEVLVGNAVRRKDPLVLNFSGAAAQLTDQVFRFDVDADGTPDTVHQLAPGSGYLVFDKNGDGKANDGSELFGTASGDGFADLARHDQDGNGWIDEGDAIFTRLRVWQPAASGGGGWQTLAEAGVGAIAVARVATPFALRSDANAAYGDIVSSGVFLREDGGVGSVQQVDLAV